MKEISANPESVAYCGLYCGACRSYLKDKCPGCHGNEKATWCKLRTCCIEKGFLSCAECPDYGNVNDCEKFDNFIAKIFGFVFNSDRGACIRQIKEFGIEKHAAIMADRKSQSLPRRKKA
jgi:hypothetical protein